MIGLKEEDQFLEDTKRHDLKLKEMNKLVFRKLDTLTPHESKFAIDKYLMSRTPNKQHLFKQIDEDFGRVKHVLDYVLRSNEDPVVKINNMLDKEGQLYLKGAGIFAITQLLASAYPDRYVVLEDNISTCLRFLGMTDVLITTNTANGYIYVNEICKKLCRAAEMLPHMPHEVRNWVKEEGRAKI